VIAVALLAAVSFAQDPAPASDKPQSQAPTQTQPQAPDQAQPPAPDQSKAPDQTKTSDNSQSKTPAPPQLQPAPQNPITLDTSETLFSVLTALNSCGYDVNLKVSDAQRVNVRFEVQRNIRNSDEGQAALGALCEWYQAHKGKDPQHGGVAEGHPGQPRPAAEDGVDSRGMPYPGSAAVNDLPALCIRVKATVLSTMMPPLACMRPSPANSRARNSLASSGPRDSM